MYLPFPVTDSSPASPGLFAHRGYVLYLGTRALSTAGMQVLSVAVGWYVYDLTRDPFALGYVGLAQFLPMFLFVLPAGDLADRVDRRLILMGSYLVQAASAGILLWLAFEEVHEVEAFYAALALFGFGRAFTGPASQSLIPLLVPTAKLSQAIALSSSVFQVMVIGGPAAGGAIYLLGPAAAFGACFVLFLIVAFGLVFVRTIRSQAPQTSRLGALARVMEGIAFVRSRPVVLGAISLDLFAVLLGGATALLPIYARDILEVGPEGLGILRSAPGVGAAVIGLILSRYALARHAGRAMFACVALFGLATVVFGLSENFWLSLGALAVLGASDQVSVYVRLTLVQLATPDQMRGRVSSVNMLFINASNELGEFESGITAGWWGAVPAVIVGGLGTLGVVGLWMWLFPQLTRVDRLADVAPDKA